MKRRSYTKKARALSEAETRQRIIDATVGLHEEQGPARTTVSAIAERAGVQRLTVYRHFPDEVAIFSSCAARWAEFHSPPDLSSLRSVDAGRARARKILVALYGYYRGGQKMLTHLQVDRDRVPAIDRLMEPFQHYLDALVEELEHSWPRCSSRRRITIRFAVQFATWNSLSQLSVGDREIADLVLRWIDHS
jgi:AcrR family transcriptional regulator